MRSSCVEGDLSPIALRRAQLELTHDALWHALKEGLGWLIQRDRETVSLMSEDALTERESISTSPRGLKVELIIFTQAPERRAPKPRASLWCERVESKVQRTMSTRVSLLLAQRRRLSRAVIAGRKNMTDEGDQGDRKVMIIADRV